MSPTGRMHPSRDKLGGTPGFPVHLKLVGLVQQRLPQLSCTLDVAPPCQVGQIQTDISGQCFLFWNSHGSFRLNHVYAPSS